MISRILLFTIVIAYYQGCSDDHQTLPSAVFCHRQPIFFLSSELTFASGYDLFLTWEHDRDQQKMPQKRNKRKKGPWIAYPSELCG